MTKTQLIINHLIQHPGATIADIATALAHTKASVKAVLYRLQMQGRAVAYGSEPILWQATGVTLTQPLGVRVRASLEALKDGDWHTTREVGDHCGIITNEVSGVLADQYRVGRVDKRAGDRTNEWRITELGLAALSSERSDPQAIGVSGNDMEKGAWEPHTNAYRAAMARQLVRESVRFIAA